MTYNWDVAPHTQATRVEQSKHKMYGIDFQKRDLQGQMFTRLLPLKKQWVLRDNQWERRGVCSLSIRIAGLINSDVYSHDPMNCCQAKVPLLQRMPGGSDKTSPVMDTPSPSQAGSLGMQMSTVSLCPLGRLKIRLLQAALNPTMYFSPDSYINISIAPSLSLGSTNYQPHLCAPKYGPLRPATASPSPLRWLAFLISRR